MKKRALAVMLAGALTLGAQTGVWAASDTSDQKEGELTLLMLNNWIDETEAKRERACESDQNNMKKRIQGWRSHCREFPSRILRNLSRQQLWQEAEQTL